MSLGTIQLEIILKVIRFLETRAARASEAIARREDANNQHAQALKAQIVAITNQSAALAKKRLQADALSRNLSGLTK